MKCLELGVFLPVAKNGFIRSTNGPAYYPSFQDNLDISRLAEEIGLDYVFAMSKWKGFGGKTRFWDASLESFSLMAGLAAATRRLKLVATVNPLLFHPVLMAKMSATIDDVSKGRLGLNLITGATAQEYAQMGVLPEGYDQKRYAYATEWVEVLKRLWNEPSVTHRGEFFHLENCVSEPKPVQKPHPFLVCAGASDEGLGFVARHTDYSFVIGRDVATLREKTDIVRRIAAAQGRAIKTATSPILMIGDSKSHAEAYWKHLVEGADVEALTNSARILMAQSREGHQKYGAERLVSLKISSGQLILGGPKEVAEGLAELAEEGGVDSLALVFPDYMDGLQRLRSDVLPILRNLVEIGP